MECTGIHDILSKSFDSSNAINITRAAIAALRDFEQSESVAAYRGLPLRRAVLESMLRARAEAETKARSEKETKAIKAESEAAAAGVGA